MSPASRRLVVALRFVALVLVGLFVAAPWFSEESAWGLWPATYVPVAWRWGLAAVAAGLVVGGERIVGWARGARRGRSETPEADVRHGVVPLLGRVAAGETGPARTPAPPLRCSAGAGVPALRDEAARAMVAAGAGVGFWVFRTVHTRWGDAYVLVKGIPHPEVHLTYTWQAPLDVYLHAQVWAAGRVLFGWADAMPAYWLLSTLAGVAFVWVLLGLARWLGRDGTERGLMIGLVASLGTMQLFFGYPENYTLMTLGILVYAWLALRALRGEISLSWPALALSASSALHPMTLILVPSLLYLWWTAAPAGRRPSERGRWKRIRRRATMLAPVAVPYGLVIAGVVALMAAGGHGPALLFGSDAPGGADRRWLVPLVYTSTRWEHYTMFSLSHLRDIVNQQLLAAPAVLSALTLAAALAWPRVRAAFRGGTAGEAQVGRFLATMAGCHLLLTWVWNPDYGGQRDWDLFATAAVPCALLLAYLLPRALPERPALRAASWALVSAQALHTVAWVYQNTLPWSWL